MDQRSYDQKSPTALRQIEVPDNIPNYEQTIQMSRKLDIYFAKKNIHWVRGREAFMFGFRKKSKQNP